MVSHGSEGIESGLMGSENAGTRKRPVVFIVLAVMFTFIVLAFTIIYLVVWRVPDHKAEIEKIKTDTIAGFDASNAIPVSENAWFDYESAMNTYFQLLPKNDSTTLNKVSDLAEKGIQKNDIPYIQQLEKKYAVVLKKIDQGYEKPQFYIPLEYKKGTSAPVVNFIRMRQIIHLLLVMGDYEKLKGNNRQALRRYSQALYAGQALQKDSHLIRYLVGISINNMACSHLQALINDTDEDAGFYKLVVTEMERYRKYSMPLHSCLNGELVVLEFTFDDIIKNGGRNLGIQVPSYYTPGMGGFFFERERKIYENWHMTALKAMNDSYSSSYNGLKKIPAPRYSLIAAILIPDISRMYAQTTRVQVIYRGVETLAALKWYRKEKGIYPDSLDVLVPGYLPAIPADPFDKNGKLIYVKNGNTILLYSLGNDLVDDKGQRNATNIDDTGDIVFAGQLSKKSAPRAEK